TEPEEPVVRRLADQDPAEDEPDAAADTRDRRQQADSARDALRRELVAHDREAEREDAAADALDDSAGDNDPQGSGQRCDDRSGGERAKRDHEQPSLAVY